MRPVQDYFVAELLVKMEAQMVDPAFPIQVKGPMDDGTYIIINGQHRYHASTKFYERKRIPLHERVLNCMVYPPNLDIMEELVIAANPTRESLPDDICTKYKRLCIYFQNLRKQNILIDKQKVAIQYSPKEGVSDTNQWVYQLRKVCEFPFGVNFPVLNIKSSSLECRGMKQPTAKTGKNVTPEKKLLFSQFKYDIKEEPVLLSTGEASEDFGGYLYFLHGKCLLHPYSYTTTGYAGAYKLLIASASCLSGYLNPRQIAPIIEVYLKSLDRVLDEVDGEEADTKKAAKAFNDQFFTFWSILSDILTFLHTQVKNVQTSVLPILPGGMKFANEIQVKDLELGDIYQLVRDLLSEEDFEEMYTHNWNRQKKAVIVGNFFNSNIGAVILTRWKNLFTDQSVRTITPNTSTYFPKKLKELNGKEYCFWNGCAFAYLEKAYEQKEKFNLILGDIPVSSSLIC